MWRPPTTGSGFPAGSFLRQYLDAAAEVGATGLIVHGGHVLKNDDPAIGFDNWRKCIDGLEMRVPLLIENTAGGDNAMARRLERIARLWDAIGQAKGGDTVGFCLDTCHAHAGGEELVGLVDRVKAITGRIDLVHANDSRDAFDSGADRHANFGEGEVGTRGPRGGRAYGSGPGRCRNARRPGRSGLRHRLAQGERLTRRLTNQVVLRATCLTPTQRPAAQVITAASTAHRSPDRRMCRRTAPALRPRCRSAG